MRKYVKIHILKMIDQLYENNDLLKKLIHKNDNEILIDTLVNSQSIIIDIGTEIERTEKEVDNIIIEFEKYCDLLFECSQMDTKIEKQKVLKLIIKNTHYIKNLIEEEIKEQYVIVFLPYKASMWDSLESIWLASNEDDECISFVMPIPYFDKNPDGTFGKMHYEGKEFPENVPITDYRDLNLEEIYPEIIYFHNPYDEFNKVTTVHPNYYSSRLKECTNMLVYIPYFVAMENMPKHFCNTKGVYNADRVILQSDGVANIYKENFIESSYISNSREISEKKFLALGSPKFDKVINTKKEDITIPREWEKLIYKEDGSMKKIVFYNITIDGLLRAKEQMIRKIKDVIEDFKRKEDTVLLFRPHPLILATINSMATELKESYLNIIDDYKKNNLGIYDDTSDLHRAIAISDMYYGDKSSVVELYKLTNKPILIQNLDNIKY